MKTLVLIFSAIGSVILLITKYSVDINLCNQVDYNCRKFFDNIENILYLFPLILLFSFVVYFMNERVFFSWWRFAKYAIPIILIINTIIVSGILHNPTGRWQDIFDIPIIISLYTIFIIGSLIQIYRGYRAR